MDAQTKANAEDEPRGIPDYDYKIGLIRLNRFIEKEEPEPVR